MKYRAKQIRLPEIYSVLNAAYRDKKEEDGNEICKF
jgi:hypothetical protein